MIPHPQRSVGISSKEFCSQWSSGLELMHRPWQRAVQDLKGTAQKQSLHLIGPESFGASMADLSTSLWGGSPTSQLLLTATALCCQVPRLQAPELHVQLTAMNVRGCAPARHTTSVLSSSGSSGLGRWDERS